MRTTGPAFRSRIPAAPAAGIVFSLLVLLLGTPRLIAQAPDTVTRADVARLDDALFEASTDVSQLRTGDAALGQILRPTLDLLREEVTHLRVALRNGEPVSWRALVEVRDRIDDVRRRARGEETLNAAGLGPGVDPPPPGPPVDPVELPAGTRLAVRLLGAVDGPDVRAGDVVEASVTREIRAAARVVIPAGALLTGRVVRAAGATPAEVLFDQVLVNYRTYRLRATVVGGASEQAPVPPLATGAELTTSLERPVAIGR